MINNDHCNNCYQDTSCNCNHSNCSYQPSAEYVSRENQCIDHSNVSFINFPFVAIPPTDCICLVDNNTIELKPGRYSISYYTTITNSLDDASHDSFSALLYVNNSPLEYTRSNVRLDDPNAEYIGFLSKTNLISVEYTANIQFGIQINSSIFPDPVFYFLHNVAVVVQKIG